MDDIPLIPGEKLQATSKHVAFFCWWSKLNSCLLGLYWESEAGGGQCRGQYGLYSVVVLWSIF